MVDASVGPLDRIATWVAGASADWSPEAVHGATRAFIDTVGCSLAGATDPATRAVAGGLETFAVTGGSSLVLGTSQRHPAPWAALMNGTAAHALDYDDVLEASTAHASAVLVPAVLALGEHLDASGERLLDAFLVGYEVLARLGEAVNMAHYQRGWHTTLSLGAPAAAAACARLLGLDREAARNAISAAVSTSAGLKRQFGTMTKPLHAGLAAHHGILAASIARSGLTGAADILEGRRGFLECYAGTDPDLLDAAVDRLGTTTYLEEHGIWLKPFPCCSATHRPVDALLTSCAANDVTVADVQGIRASISGISMENLTYPRPRTELQARFSLEYCLVNALRDGGLKLGTFTLDAVQDAEIQPLLPLVTVEEDPEQPSRQNFDTAPEAATVEIQLHDGRMLSETVEYPTGHPEKPMSDALLETKFRDCASRALSDDRVSEALDLLWDLERLPVTRSLADALQG